MHAPLKVLVGMMFPMFFISHFQSIWRWMQFDKDQTAITSNDDMIQNLVP